MECGVQNIFLFDIIFIFVYATCNLQFSAFKEFPFTVLTTLTSLEIAFYTIEMRMWNILHRR